PGSQWRRGDGSGLWCREPLGDLASVRAVTLALQARCCFATCSVARGPVNPMSLRRKQYRLSLKHLNRQEQRNSGVEAGTEKEQRHVIPMIRPGDELLAEQGHV